MKAKKASFQTSRSGLPLADPAGIGLRPPHYQDLLDQKPAIGWLEIHPENYFGGGMNRHFLTKARENYDMSFHAVGLSLGSAEGIDKSHLQKIKELIDIFEPFRFSDHASWSASGNAHLNDLLPLPYTEETLQILCDNVNEVQDFLGRKILVENPSSYIAFSNDEMSEYEFLGEAAKRTGCGLLLDINNIYVQSRNHGIDPYAYIESVPPEKVGEIHLAGFTLHPVGSEDILIDTHSRPVQAGVWDLYTQAIERFGTIPTLIEWDDDIPPLATLVGEAEKARAIMKQHSKRQKSCAAE